MGYLLKKLELNLLPQKVTKEAKVLLGTNYTKLLFVGILEHVLLAVKLIIRAMLWDRPQWVRHRKVLTNEFEVKHLQRENDDLRKRLDAIHPNIETHKQKGGPGVNPFSEEKTEH